MKKYIVVSLLLLPLAACSWGTTDTPAPDDGTTVVTERPETKNVIYRGHLLPLGASIYMEGSHRLELEDGRFVLLESDGLLLDEYVNKDVEVFGSTRATIEGSAIIMRVERIAELSESSAPAIESSSSSSAAVSSSPVAVSSAAPVVPAASSAKPVAASSAAPVVSSKAPVAVASSAPAAVASSSVSSVDAAFEARVTAMAKAKMDAANWSQQYCAPSNLAFCFPVHKNWWYTSFGATSSSLWHVEMSSEELVALGDGPIAVVLVSGNASVPDGTVSTANGVALGVRAWTNNRHIEIRGPAALSQAVAYITAELKPAPTAVSSASAQ